jgi:hypothetical protein
MIQGNEVLIRADMDTRIIDVRDLLVIPVVLGPANRRNEVFY